MLTEEIEEIDESELHAKIRSRRVNIFATEEYLEPRCWKAQRLGNTLKKILKRRQDLWNINTRRQQQKKEKDYKQDKRMLQKKIKILSWISETATIKNGSRIGRGL